MTLVGKCGSTTSLIALALSAAWPLQAQAQDMGSPWKWEAAVYGWFPGINATTSFPVGADHSIDLSSGDVIDALKFAFMGNIGVSNGRWGAWTDLMYADIGGSKQGTRNFTIDGHPIPVGVNGNISLDAKTWLWTAVGTFTAVSKPELKLDLIGGLRMLDMTQTVNWSFSSAGPLPISNAGEGSVSATNWDAIIGIKGRAYLGEERQWFIPYYLDVGTGDSKSTWQGNIGIGYRFGWGAVVASWRYVDYRMDSGQPVSDLNFSGPLIGIGFAW